jgi:hypothetical protein
MSQKGPVKDLMTRRLTFLTDDQQIDNLEYGVLTSIYKISVFFKLGIDLAYSKISNIYSI